MPLQNNIFQRAWAESAYPTYLHALRPRARVLVAKIEFL